MAVPRTTATKIPSPYANPVTTPLEASTPPALQVLPPSVEYAVEVFEAFIVTNTPSP